MTKDDDRLRGLCQLLVEFIVRDLKWDGDPDELLGDQPVQLPDILDSAALMELAAFVEDEFEVVVDDAEIDAITFGTVTGLATLVVAKQDAG